RPLDQSRCRRAGCERDHQQPLEPGAGGVRRKGSQGAGRENARGHGDRGRIEHGRGAEAAGGGEPRARVEKDPLGRVNLTHSNAPRRLHKTFFETSNEDWHFFLNQQLTASWYLAKAFVPAMVEARWGRIIHINGPDGYTGGWTRVPHSTAKGALRTLTKSL